MAELGVPGLDFIRATNQVLILLALFFLPFLVIASGKMVRSISLKLSGQEVHLELSEAKQVMQSEVQRVEAQVAGQVSTVEQAIWPLLAGPDPGCAERWQRQQIIIGSKLDPSHLFFAQLLALWIEAQAPGIHCQIRFPNGGSLKNFADLKLHWIDLYIDFTGTCCQYFNLDHREQSSATLIEQLNHYGQGIGLRWLPPLGCSENYCLAMPRETAARHQIQSLRDLTLSAGQLRFSADPEFLNRRDCYLGLASRYHLKFQQIEPCKITERYARLDSGEVDLFVAYETDPELRSRDLLVLADTEQFFPPYDAVPLASQAMLDQLPAVQHALEGLAQRITSDDLVEQVFKLRQQGLHPAIARDLAKQFLTSKGLL